MSKFAVDHLSPLAARRRLDEVDLEEKSRLTEGLALIALIDARGDYLEAGYSSMQRYCMGHMQMSEEQAQRRIRAARLGRAFPGVFEHLADGRLTLSNACELAPVLTKDNADKLLDEVAHQSKLQVRRIVIEAARANSHAVYVPAPAAESVAESAGVPAPPAAPSLADLCGVPAHDTPLTETAPARVNRQVRGRVFDTEEGARGLRVVLTDEEFAHFKQAQDLLAHVVRNGDPAVVVARALAHFAAHLHKRRFGAKPGTSQLKRVPRGRSIPAPLRSFVAARDEYCCAFASGDGHRCGETRGLQFDHVTPVALGGETTADDLRLLCSRHNRHEAAKRLGVERVEGGRERNERARAQQKGAKKREAEREVAREGGAGTDGEAGTAADATDTAEPGANIAALALARAESDADVIAALRRLGCNLEQASLGAKRTVALADGPVEQRILTAIKLRGQGLGRKDGFRQLDAAISAPSEQFV